MSNQEPHDITQMLIELTDGNAEVVNQILPHIYDELRRLAGSYLRRERSDHTLQPTALVHEAYMKLIDQKQVRWQNRAHFFGIAAQVMRRILMDHARKHKADKRGGEADKLPLVNEVVELSKATLETALFDVPADFRQVSDSAQMYAAVPATSALAQQPSSTSINAQRDDLNASQNARNISQEGQSAPGPQLSAKKSGIVRIGIAPVKTGAVGDSIRATDLAAAIQNSLIQYLKTPNLEVVSLESKLPSLIEGESKEKECDFVIFVNVSHKKGGGGIGMFGSAFGNAVGAVGIGHTGSTAGNIAGQVATQAIVSAANVSGNIKAKDQITLDLKVQRTGGTAVASQQFTAKAKSNGDDIISQVVEPAAQAIVDAAHN